MVMPSVRKVRILSDEKNAENRRKHKAFVTETGVLWMTYSVDNVHKSVNNLLYKGSSCG
jgi:hypothetical protein